MLIRLNQIMRGWANYFRHAVCKRTLSRLDHFVWWRMIRWLRTLHRWRWKDVRRRFTDPRRAVETDQRRTGSSCSTPQRYRSPGTATGATTIPNPWTLRNHRLTAETVESPVRGERARRVRRAAWGNGPASNPGTAPQADSTREGDRALRRREVPGPGAGPDPAHRCR